MPVPIVQIELLEGRTVEQKRALVRKVTDAIVEAVGCQPEAVSIILREMKKEHFGKAGRLFSDQ